MFFFVRSGGGDHRSLVLIEIYVGLESCWGCFFFFFFFGGGGRSLVLIEIICRFRVLLGRHLMTSGRHGKAFDDK